MFFGVSSGNRSAQIPTAIRSSNPLMEPFSVSFGDGINIKASNSTSFSRCVNLGSPSRPVPIKRMDLPALLSFAKKPNGLGIPWDIPSNNCNNPYLRAICNLPFPQLATIHLQQSATFNPTKFATFEKASPAGN